MERFEDHIGLVNLLTRQAYAKAQQLGANLEFNEVFQEASLAFVSASRGYKPESGFQFSTYFTQCAWSQFRKMFKREGFVAESMSDEERAELGTTAKNKYVRRLTILSTDALMSDAGDGDDGDFFEVYDGAHSASPEEILETRQSVKALAKTLSPLAQAMLDSLLHPSAEVLAECNRIEIHRSMDSKEPAAEVVVPGLVELAQIFRAIGYSACHVENARREINRMANEL